MPNKYQFQEGDKMLQADTNPEVVKLTMSALRDISAEQINPELVLSTIRDRDGVVLTPDNKELYLSKISTALTRGVVDNVGEKIVFHYGDEEGNARESVKLINGVEASVTLERAHKIYALAAAEVDANYSYPSSESKQERVNKWYKYKLYKEMGLITEEPVATYKYRLVDGETTLVETTGKPKYIPTMGNW
jgi:hypothetical protein